MLRYCLIYLEYVCTSWGLRHKIDTVSHMTLTHYDDFASVLPGLTHEYTRLIDLALEYLTKRYDNSQDFKFRAGQRQ